MRVGCRTPCGQFVERQIGRAEAEDVGVGDGARADAEYVADDAADAGIGAAEWLERGGVIVCFDFERQVVFVVEAHDTGVIDKGGAHPRAVDLFGGGADVRVEQAVDRLGCAVGAGVVDVGFERLVDAMFAPRLRQHFEFDVGRFAAFLLDSRRGWRSSRFGRVTGGVLG